MNLKRKLLESEALGRLHMSLSGWLNQLLKDPADEERRATLQRAVDEENRFVSMVVKRLLDEHPELEPSKFDVPKDRYELIAFFIAADGLALLMRRFCHLLPKSCGARHLILCADGKVLAESSNGECLPASTVQREVSDCISAYYIPSPDELTHNLLKAMRQERERVQGIGVEHARSFLGWIMAALLVRPGLLMGFRATHVSPDGQHITLREVELEIGHDPLGGWLTKP